MNILITGGTGFIGSQIVQKLHKRGHNLYIVTRFPNNKKNIERITYIDNSKETLRSTYSKHVDVTLHLATNYGRGNTDFDRVATTNVKFPEQVLQEAVRAKSKYFINTDSYYTKHHLDFPQLENYTKSKKAFYEVLTNENQIYHLNVILYHVYGRGDNSNKLIPTVVHSLTREKQPIKLSACSQRIDIIDIEQTTKAFVHIVENIDSIKQQSIRSIEVGEGRATQLSTILNFIHQIIRDHQANTPDIAYSENSEYPNLAGREYMANTKILQSLGWKPSTNVLKKLTRFIEYELRFNNSNSDLQSVRNSEKKSR